MKKNFFIIDGNSFLHRAFHALPPLTNAKGFPTNAITGSLNMIMGLQTKHKPEKMVVVFDAKGNNFRHDIYSEYKANRSSMAEDLRVQIEPLHSIIKAWGIPIVIIEGVEADDTIATLAKIGVAQGYTSVMVTSDKDLKQFVTEDVLILDTKDTEKGNSPYGKEGVFEKEGVYPENIRLKLSLMGDSVDNVPGVPSVGPKTAIKWIEEYKNLEGIIKNSINIKGAVGEKLRDNIELLKLSYELVGIKDDLDIDINISELEIVTDEETLYNYIEEFELNKLKKDLGIESKDLEESSFEIIENRIPTFKPDSQYIYINSFFNDNELYCVFSICKEKVYVFKAIDYQEELKNMMSEPFKAIGFNTKETIKNISYVCGIYPNYYAKIKDITNSNYILEGGRSQKTNLSYLNEKYAKIKTSELRNKYKLDEAKSKLERMTYSELVEVKSEENIIIFSIYDNLNKLINDQRSLYVENDLSLILGKMEKNGCLINVEHFNKLKESFESELKIIEERIFDKAGKSFNINSPKQVGEVLFVDMGIPSKTKSTSEKVLKELEKDNDIITDIFNYRSLSKLISTYIIGLLSRKDNNDRVHTTFNQSLTSTGRLSSEDPNLQNIPIKSEEGKRIREAFIAEKGSKIVAVDYSQIELRILAILSGDEKLIEAFEKGLDIHRSTAAEIFDIAYEEVSVEQRRIAKSINFGLIYGLGAKNLAKELGITLKEAKLYQEKYFSTYESIKPFFEKQLEYARKNLHVCTYFNRKINTKDINTTNNMIKTHAERAANNASIQGTAADIIKLAMISVDGYITSNRVDAKLLLQVHDELVFEVKEDILEDFSKNISRLMENVISEKVPLIVESNFGDNWLEAH